MIFQELGERIDDWLSTISSRWRWFWMSKARRKELLEPGRSLSMTSAAIVRESLRLLSQNCDFVSRWPTPPPLSRWERIRRRFFMSTAKKKALFDAEQATAWEKRNAQWAADGKKIGDALRVRIPPRLARYGARKPQSSVLATDLQSKGSDARPAQDH